MPSTHKISLDLSKLLQEWAATGVAAALGVALALAASLTNFDFINLNLMVLNGIKKHQVDDILVGFALLFAGVALDRWLSNRRKRRQAEAAEGKLRILKATMRTVQDIVNNFLNNIQFFRMETEGTLPQQTLEHLDAVI